VPPRGAPAEAEMKRAAEEWGKRMGKH